MWDARRGRPEVPRTELDDVVAKLDGQYTVEDVESVFLCGVDMQGRAVPYASSETRKSKRPSLSRPFAFHVQPGASRNTYPSTVSALPFRSRFLEEHGRELVSRKVEPL